MKSVVFGNPYTDWWKLTLECVSKREQGIALTGELRAGFFHAITPMFIPPSVLDGFAAELETLDRTLAGTATLANSNMQSEVSWVLAALPLGHIESRGRYTINGNYLEFSFRTDQTQLSPLLRWVRRLRTTYDNSNDAESGPRD